MADKKISELTAATTVNTTDSFVLVQGGSTLKVTADVLFNKVPRNVVITETAEDLASGALSTTLAFSKVTPAGAPTAYTLAAGVHGTTKWIVCEVFTSGTAVVTVTGGKGFTTLTFNAVGDAIQLQNVAGYWYVGATSSLPGSVGVAVA